MKPEVWLIDDDDSIRWVLEQALSEEDLNVRSFSNADSALDAFKLEQPDVVLTDIRMPGTDGLELLEHLHQVRPDIPIVVMTAHTDLDSALSAYSGGAFEYLPKPFDLDETLLTIHRAIDSRKPSILPAIEQSDSNFIGNARSMQEVFRLIGRLSKSDLSVLVTGETGTGKEVIAQTLHSTSPRATAPFVALNTAAIPAELLESELFGHEKGAFTGAQSARTGRFEQADGGTLFLDEIGDMPASMQTRLLRVLSQGEFFRVGGHRLIKVDVRIVAATHQNLEEKVNQGEFREDLFHRLNVVRLRVPPLRERQADIPALTEYFLKRAAEETGLDVKHFSSEALAKLAQYNWPGNVRELENLCQRQTVMAPAEIIQAHDLPTEINQDTIKYSTTENWQAAFRSFVQQQLQASQPDLAHEVIEEIETILLQEALNISCGKKKEAAERLGWGRNTLTRKLPLLEVE